VLIKKEVEDFIYHFFEFNREFLGRIVDSFDPTIKLIACDHLIEDLIKDRSNLTEFESTVILRSVTTSGIRCVNLAKSHELNSCEIVSIFDRGLGAKEFVESSGFSFRSIMNINI
jgi:hypothetical protein